MANVSELQKIAALINASTTGAIASIAADHVSVAVPGLQSMPGGRVAKIYSTEKVRTIRAALRLIASME